MADIVQALEHNVRHISELTDDSLNTLMLSIERAYIHALIEKSLRSRPDPGVSRVMERVRQP